jgi:hypothetical protein
MAAEMKDSSLPVWKPLGTSCITVGLPKLLIHWLSEPLAWGIAGVAAILFLYEVPPRLGSPPNLGKSILLAVATGLALFAISKVW